jgi:hypothetical protein
VNDKLWKFGQKFGIMKLVLKEDSATKTSFDIDISFSQLMNIRYKYRCQVNNVLYEDFYFSMFNRELYHRPILRKENWNALYQDEIVSIFRVSDLEVKDDEPLYERLFIIGK